MQQESRKAIILLIVLSLTSVIYIYSEGLNIVRPRSAFLYDERHVKPSESFEGKKGINGKPLKFDVVGSIGELSATLTNCWSNDPGDFRRVSISLKSGQAEHFDNSDGGWINIADDTYCIPVSSGKVQRTPYGMVLNLEDKNKILALFGYHYPSDPSGLLTLIHISADTAEVVFNKEFNAKEITETAEGYKIIGSLYCGCWCREPHEIVITPKSLKLQELSFEEVYKDKELPITLYNAPSWGLNKQSGEFTRITIPHYEEPDEVFNLDHSDVLTQVPEDITLPTHAPGIEKTPYYIKLRDQVLIFFARPYDGSEERITTIVSLTNGGPLNDIAAPIFDRKFYLTSITKTATGYHCAGTDLEDPATGIKPIEGFDIVIDQEAGRAYVPW